MRETDYCEIDTVDLTASLDPELTAELAELCCFALEIERGVQNWMIALVLTSDEHIGQLHQQFMGIPGPTDILTFEDDESSGGDIVISVEQAERQRHDDDWSLAEELRFLVVHGALHLTGWNDASSDQRAAMLDRQRQIIREFQADSSNTR